MVQSKKNFDVKKCAFKKESEPVKIKSVMIIESRRPNYWKIESGKFWKIEAKDRSSGLLNSTNDLKVAGSNLIQY